MNSFFRHTVLTALSGGAVQAGEATRPNILFIMSDDHALQALGAYGASLNETPQIDRIASEGALFLNNFCGNSICGPSRASVLTGKHSHKNGFLSNNNVFDGSQPTFPALLRKAGYRTAIIGKWHLNSVPQGFDHWMVYPDQGNYYNPDYITPEGTNRLYGYSVEVTTDLALEYIKKLRMEGDQPFLLMCQYKAPHRQWNPGPRYLSMYNDRTFPEPETLFDDYAGRASPAAEHKMGIAEHLRMGIDLFFPAEAALDWERMTPEQQSDWKAAFDAANAAERPDLLSGQALTRWKYQRYIKNYLRCVAAVDDNVGRLLAYLKESGLDQNTIVIYSSDQGFYLGEHGWFDKRWMYEESFRMPLVMRWPGKISPGLKIEALTQNIDFAPTLLEAAGISSPADMQGRSLLPLLAGEEPADWRNSLYYHYYQHGAHGVARHEGVRTDRYKLIHYYTTDEWELFDLEKDPSERTSFYDHPEYREIRSTLARELLRLREQYDVPDDNLTGN